MKNFLLASLVSAASFLSGPATFAGPFEPKDVAADPAILCHLDFDTLRGSDAGQHFLADEGVQKKLATVEALFDFDFRSQLHGLTVYTTQEHPKEGVLIVYADFDPTRLIELAKDKNFSLNIDLAGPDSKGEIKVVADPKDYKPDKKGSHVIYSWKDVKKGGKARVYGAMWGSRAVFAKNEDHLVDALNVIAGKDANFAGKPGLPQAEPGERLLGQGVVFQFDSGDDGPEAMIFKMSKAVRVKLSEANTNVVASVRLDAPDPAAATNLKQVVQGLLALIKLQAPKADDLKELNSIEVRQEDATVDLTLSIPSSELIQKTKLDDVKSSRQK